MSAVTENPSAASSPISASAPATANLRVYNTLTRTKEPFTTVKPGKVGIYLCGPTVYKEAHMGHMVGPVIFDTIKRYLAYSGYEVTWVANITDVDDKLIIESNKRGIPMGQVATEMTLDYLNNLKALGVDQIDSMPKATENIPEIISIIEQLIAKGFAYASAGDVLFDVTKDPNYGKLTNRSVDSLQGEGGEASSKKRSPGDFALWKAAKAGEPYWDSPWGPGRPGWHIECSAMSRRILGETFDIHGGGLDLIFPHHENEIAQSECCHGKPMAKVWMHNGLLRSDTSAGKLGGRGGRGDRDAAAPATGAATPTLEEIKAQTAAKIARSTGGGGLHKLIEQHGGETLRFFLLRNHYRSTILWGEEPLAEARTALETFYRLIERYERVTGESFYELKPTRTRAEGNVPATSDAVLAEVAKRRTAFLEKMDDDFNTGGAVSELFELVRGLNKLIDSQNLEDAAKRSAESVATLKQGVATLRELTAILGIFRAPPAKKAGASDDVVNGLMALIIELRAEARKKKDFPTSDKIRDGLGALKITLEDRKDGTIWRQA